MFRNGKRGRPLTGAGARVANRLSAVLG
jgi:hypothetical protein